MTGPTTMLARACKAVPFLRGLFLVCALSGAAHGDALPRYKLVVGQELVYRLTVPTQEIKTSNGTIIRKRVIEWNLWVARQNEDRSWRLAFVERRTNSSESPDREPSVQTGVTEGYFDLAADGQIEETGIRGHADPTLLFPPLPPDESSLAAAWQMTLSHENRRRNVRLAGRDRQNDTWNFVEDVESLSFKAAEFTSRREYLFDNDLGLIRRGTLREATKRRVETAVPLVLVSTNQIKGDDLALFQTQIDRYFQARSAYQQWIDRATLDLVHAADCLDRADAQLKTLEVTLHDPPVRSILENKLKEATSTREFLMSTAKTFTPLVGKPSENWQTTDLDEGHHSLEDYRGKVVVLDFWYRGCGPCLRSMPQMKQLAQEFERQPVIVLGLNSDSRDTDAKFVIDTLELNYPTLRNGRTGEGIDSKYGVTGYPSFVVIDPRGVVQHVHVGLSFTLRHDLGEKIRQLLAEKE